MTQEPKIEEKRSSTSKSGLELGSWKGCEMGSFTVEKAIQIAAAFHEGQKRWNGSPYILHPLRVMARMTTDDERIVAVLHDTLEDTELTVGALLGQGCPKHLVEAIEALTKPSGAYVTNLEKDSAYLEYLVKVRANPLSRVVKIADIEDNLNLSDLGTPIREKDLRRVGKYIEALKFVRSV